MSTFALLDRAAAQFGDRGAVFLGEQQLHTWAELRDRALRLAGSIRRTHPAGSRIAIASETRPEIIELMFATWAAECVVVPINYKLHALEMRQIIEDSGAALVFASPKIAAELTVAAEVIGSNSYSARLNTAPTDIPDPEPTDLAWLFFTSGCV